MNRILEAIKPEAVFFTEQDGRRGIILIADLADPSKVPALAEPRFLTFEADVQFRIVMTPEDLKKAGLDDFGKKWGDTRLPGSLGEFDNRPVDLWKKDTEGF